jgi:fatty-acyl-CoA synthase
MLKAFVALKRGRKFDDNPLADYSEKALARFKVPKQFELIDGLPRNPSGKVLKTELRKLDRGSPS